MYRPLPKNLTIKDSKIDGLGLFSKAKIKKNSFIGISHVKDDDFQDMYIRTPLGGFYNHSKNPNVTKLSSNTFPKYCLLYTSPSPRDLSTSRMPSSA